MLAIAHAGRWTLADRFGATWHYLPFEVPRTAWGIRVDLDYRPAGPVVDLGCLGPAGFRGWSGGARQSFVITARSATPGYLPGALEPGGWQVIIGLHRLPLAGVDYQLTVHISTTPAELVPDGLAEPVPPVTDRPARRILPASTGRRWLAGDLHSHTVHSDGTMTVPELARFAAGRGLDFIGVTDHNTVSHHAELPAAAAAHGIVLLPGQEITTDAGHANAFGDIGWIDFRASADGWLTACEQAGGLLSVNHPVDGQLSWTRSMQRRPPLLEVWHSSWRDARSTAPIGWWQAWHPAAIPIGGSDWHQPGNDAPPGAPTTWVEAEADDPVAVLQAIGDGRTAVSAGRTGPVLIRLGDELVAADADDTILVGPDGPKAAVRGTLARFPAAGGCHRLVDATGATLALTG